MAAGNPLLASAAPLIAIACIATAVLGWSTGYRLPLVIVAAASVLLWLRTHIRKRGWGEVSPLVAALLGFAALAIGVLLVLSAAVLWIGMTRGLHD